MIVAEEWVFDRHQTIMPSICSTCIKSYADVLSADEIVEWLQQANALANSK
jgi:hypothetical protein